MAGDAESVVSMPQLHSGTSGTDERAALITSYTADHADTEAASPAPSTDARGGCGSLFRPPLGADLSTRMVAAYGVGCFTMSMLVDLPSFYYNPFLLEVALMDPIYVGNLLLTCKVCSVPRNAAQITVSRLMQRNFLSLCSPFPDL